MANRYFIKYFDVVDVEHRLNIYDDNFEGEATQIGGRITLTYAETEDPLEAIRGQGLSVELEADVNLTFNDLWSETQKTFRVEYKRDDVILFQGWLNPEGFFENYVDTNWLVTFDCVDGLGYLKDLSFVEENGLPITGRKTYIEVLAKALNRTGLNQRINTDVQIRYNGLSASLDVLANVYANTERYIKDDGETIMSCDEVIRDILEPFGAVLTAFGGEWYIYKPNQLYLNETATFYKYTSDGVAIGAPFEEPTKTIDFSLVIGSNWYGVTPHHCNANQQIRNKNSIGAYRINYKYGLSQSLIDNSTLYSADGVTLQGWDILDDTTFEPLVADGYGVTFNNTNSAAGDPEYYSLRNSNLIPVEDQNRFTISSKWDIIDNGDNFVQLHIRVLMCDGDINDVGTLCYRLIQYYDVTTGTFVEEWASGVSYGSLPSLGVEYDGETRNNANVFWDIDVPPKPAAITGDGYIYFEVRTPQMLTTDSGLYAGQSELYELKISPILEGEGSNIVGEFHTVERLNNPSAKVEDVKTVATGDNIADFYEGTIYKSDASTPTETWNRKGFAESKPLLQIMGEETLRMSQLPARVFSGDVFGYFNYMSVVDIKGLNSKFMPIAYEYDTRNNVINAEFRQIYGNELTDIDYKKTKDFGNTVKPTIKG